MRIVAAAREGVLYNAAQGERRHFVGRERLIEEGRV